jgi:hypothetical protein
MTQHYLHRHLTPAVGKAQLQSYGQSQGVQAAPEPDRLGPRETAFISARDSFYLASLTTAGAPYIQHRGGPIGFLRVLDERTLGFADYAGFVLAYPSFPRAELLRITEAQPAAWAVLMQLVLRNQALLLSLLGAVRSADAEQRVALTLLNLAREIPEGEEGIAISQTEIGAIACMSRGAVNAALAALEGRGLIRRSYRGVGIVSIAGLTAFAAGG